MLKLINWLVGLDPGLKAPLPRSFQSAPEHKHLDECQRASPQAQCGRRRPFRDSRARRQARHFFAVPVPIEVADLAH